MISVKCPNCGKELDLYKEELEELKRYGKIVISDCDCGQMFVVEDDGDCVFTH